MTFEDSGSIDTESIYTSSSVSSEELWSNFSSLTVFPRMEGATLEFKQSISLMHYKKIPETLCGFLNTDGGTMMFGIRDDSAIVGLHSSQKEIDNFLLQIDRIFHEAEIRTTDLERVHPSCVKTNVLQCHNGRYVVAIHVSPFPGKQYQLKDGTVWFRLNASNYKITGSDHLYTESDMRIQIARTRKNMSREFSLVVRDLRSSIRSSETTIRSLQTSLNKKMTDAEESLKLLHEKILNEKAAAEKLLRSQMFSLFCGIF